MTELLQTWLTNQAERRPEATAVVLEGERLTYGQLEQSSNQLARVLREGGCTKGDRVCLLIPKGPAAIVAILGVLKADGIYVPLDPSSPPARLAKVLRSCESRWLLATAGVAPALDRLVEDVGPQRPAIGSMDRDRIKGDTFTAEFSALDLLAYPGAAVEYSNTGRDPAYILFTSGSTGTPKGVVITHSNVTCFVEWANAYFGTGSSDRNSGHPPLHFDLSTYDIFGTFAAGAELHLVPPHLNLLPNKVADFIRAAELTQWFSVPSILNYMAKLDVVRPHDFPTLRRLLWCGEVFPTPALKYWMTRLPHVTFTNLYGPTEATIASSYYTVPRCPADERAATPIGTGCAGEELLVLDAGLRPVRSGEIGDLYIRGVGLSPGYWREPDKTRAVFLPNPFRADPADRIYKTGDLARIGDDGLVYFVGRADSQVKSRGYRIELGEIEAALSALDCAQECAVVAIPTDGFEGAVICCAYVPAPGVEVTPPLLRQRLSALLPTYMLPSRWMALAALPKNINGKCDRTRLRAEFHRSEAGTV
jgi:amino acid adenylation domain-containing protein